MKKEELKSYIFSKTAIFELRIPLWIGPKTIITDKKCDIVIESYAVYKRCSNYVYNEMNEKLYEYSLHHIMEKIE